MTHRPHIGIVGGGLAGATAAWALARSGARVTVFDRDRIASGASGAAAGMMQPLTGKRLALHPENLAGFERTLHILREDLPEFSVWKQPGVVRLLCEEEWVEPWRARLAAFPSGLAYWMESQTLHEMEPRLSDRVLAGICIPDACMIDVAAFVRALLQHAQAEVVEHTIVHALEAHAHGVTMRTGTDHRCYDVDAVVVASGASGPAPLPEREFNMRPFLGVLATFGGIRPPCMSLNYHGYITPWHNGHVLVGTVNHLPPFDEEPSAASIKELRAQLTGVLHLENEPILQQAWMGIRPTLPDHHPIARPAHTMPHTWVFTGFGGRGLLVGPMMAEALAQDILQHHHA